MMLFLLYSGWVATVELATHCKELFLAVALALIPGAGRGRVAQTAPI